MSDTSAHPRRQDTRLIALTESGEHPAGKLSSSAAPRSKYVHGRNATLLVELLSPRGYATAQFGKNHLGDRDEFLPTVQGFDEFLGSLPTKCCPTSRPTA